MSNEPTRADLEFMADCLGLRARVDYEPHACVLSNKPSLASTVAAGMADPIANARTQERIADLLCDLPPRGYYAPARHERLPSGHVFIS